MGDQEECATCGGDGQIFTGAYCCYNEDGTPCGDAIYAPCPDCNVDPTGERTEQDK
jgi:hypothetical protein